MKGGKDLLLHTGGGTKVESYTGSRQRHTSKERSHTKQPERGDFSHQRGAKTNQVDKKPVHTRNSTTETKAPRNYPGQNWHKGDIFTMTPMNGQESRDNISYLLWFNKLMILRQGETNEGAYSRRKKRFLPTHIRQKRKKKQK